MLVKKAIFSSDQGRQVLEEQFLIAGLRSEICAQIYKVPSGRSGA